MELWKCARKNLTLTLKNGQTYTGFCSDFCDARDNDEGIDSLIFEEKIGFEEFFEDEIESIEVID